MDDFFKDFTEKKKHFRFKKRYSYITKDKLYRIDLSVVKSTKYFRGKHQFETTFQKANILKNREEYEVEIEYLGWKKEVGIPKIDVLSQKIRQGHILTRGKNKGNQCSKNCKLGYDHCQLHYKNYIKGDSKIIV